MPEAIRPDFLIGGIAVPAGQRQRVEIPVSNSPDQSPLSIQIEVLHGSTKGPVLFVSGAIHGDEIIGTEVSARLLETLDVAEICGTLIVVPVVNTVGFMSGSRYLHDRRDLNRSFPGSRRGSFASRLARIFMDEVVSKADWGIDLHSAAIHRANFPQLRISPKRPETLALARVFGAPVVLTAKLRPKSLRHAALKKGVDILLFEGSGGLRVDRDASAIALRGILNVMRHIGMLARDDTSQVLRDTIFSSSSSWLRAPASGLLYPEKAIGDVVEAEDRLGSIISPFGDPLATMQAGNSGIIIGATTLPVVREGDALFHIAEIERGPPVEPDAAAEILDEDEVD